MKHSNTMNVLSLFDGMSCGQIALKELGISPSRYYASEIDRHAIAQTQLNFPETIQLGDITAWRSWGIDWASIDLVLAGSPCQGFSFAGHQLAFDDPRSRLFFAFVDILKHIQSLNPNVRYLLENVRMAKKNQAVIDEIMGIRPVEIDAALVSAQRRRRLYWTNITTPEGEPIPQPADRGILLKDIIDHQHTGARWFSPERFAKVVARHERNNRPIRYAQNESKSQTLTRAASDGSTISLCAIVIEGEGVWRTFTQGELAKLQSIPSWYRWACSRHQAGQMLGNGWNVEVIKHILSYL